MSVQVGVSSTRIPVLKLGRDQPPGRNLRHPVPPGPGERGVLFQHRERCLLRRRVSRRDPLLHARARVHRPQQGGRLDRGEYEVIAGHCIALAARFPRLYPPGLGLGRLAARIAPDRVQAGCNAVAERVQLPIPGELAAQGGAPDRVVDEPV